MSGRSITRTCPRKFQTKPRLDFIHGIDTRRSLCLNHIKRALRRAWSGETNIRKNKKLVKKIKTTIAATVALAACMSAGLFAAGTDAAIAPNYHRTHVQGGSGTLATGWHGTGYDGGTGYFNPAHSDQYNPYPFYNIVGGESYGILYEYKLPDQNESPLNPQAALTRHALGAPRLKSVRDRMSTLSLRKKAARVIPARSTQNLTTAPD